MKHFNLFITLIISAATVCGQNSSKSDSLLVDELLSKMTLKEKITLIHGSGIYKNSGIPRLNIPDFYPSDGPCGLRPELTNSGEYIYTDNKFDCATAFPTLISLAATWDHSLAKKFGEAIGEEQRARGKDMYLGPAVNIMRTPLCGRNFEYMGEDPFLASRISVEVVKGVQSKDVSACIKHFALNSQELNRFSVNANPDERTLREIYLPAFETAVKEGNTMALMGAYNKFRNDWCCESDYLLHQVLKKEWGFNGVVISDWGAVHDAVKAMKAGTDMDSGNSHYYAGAEKLVEEGKLSATEIDRHAKQMLLLFCKLKMLGNNTVQRTKGSINTKEHAALANAIAASSIVLLKNDKNLLPINAEALKNILVIGKNADLKHCVTMDAKGGCDVDRFGGSGEVKPLYEITPLQGIKNFIGNKVTVDYENITAATCDARVKEKIKNAGMVILFVGDSHKEEQEGKDRTSLRLPDNQDSLVVLVSSIQPKTIVVNQSGAPVEMPWINRISTLVQYWFSGQEGGNALADVLFGKVNPSGKLPCTFPRSLAESPAHFLNDYKENEINYPEGVFVGYRWYDSKKIEPLFPFGFGLSYTDFNYGKIKINKINEDDVRVRIPITNTGKRAGEEVVQLYVHDINPAIERPEQELKGFSKVSLAPNETKVVEFHLNKRSFSYWSEKENNWKAKQGNFEIRAGSSSRDIRSHLVYKR